MRVRKKPVEVEAVQILPKRENQPDIMYFSEVPAWLNKALKSGIVKLDSTTINSSEETGKTYLEPSFIIKTLEDGPDSQVKHYASLYDWIIKGVHGELYAIKPDIFEDTYEKCS